MARELGGLWPAVISPLDESGKPALGVLEKLINLFAEQQLGGLYVVGSTGQWPLLSLEDRRAIGECAVRAAAGRIPVMLHIGASTSDDAVSLARHAERIGADAISTVAPTYYGYSADVVFHYYRNVAMASGLPLYVYHLSSVNQVRVPAQDYVRRLLELPNIAGMKITDLDLYLFGLIRNYSEGKLQLFSGADQLFCHAVLSGASGAIGTFYNLWGPACKQAREAMVAGKVEVATRFTLRFQRALDEVLSTGSTWSFLRAAMQVKYGLDVGMPRPPLGSCDKAWATSDVERIIEFVDTAN